VGDTKNVLPAYTVMLAVAVNRFAPQLAWIVLEPAAELTTKPALLTEAMVGAEELQVTVLETLSELPSL
jgi:hypothetical protein